MRHIFTLIIIILSIQLCASADDYTFSNTIRTTHFIIYYDTRQSDTAKRAGEIAERWHARLSEKLQIESAAITPIYLYPDRTAFSKATGIKPGDSIVGLAHTRALFIRIDASGAFEDISRVIPHELVHIFLSRILHADAANLPLWMHEGLAKYLSDDWSSGDADLLADIATSANFIAFNKLTNVFPSDSLGRSKAYVQSYSAIRFMAKKYSEKSLVDLLSEIAKGEDFSTAVKYSIGSTPDHFEADWRRYLMDRYRFGKWTNLWSGLVSAAMAFAALMAYKKYRDHKRQVIKRMEAEETDRQNNNEDSE
ncbi:MAG: peptidase MA family metallohydrolase [Armatimonadota bacterium]